MTITYSKSAQSLTALSREMPATCKVRNEINGRRGSSQIVKTERHDGTPGVPYQPRPFPVGRWHVLAALPKTDPYMAPVFLSTDAWQMVDEWSLDEFGAYDKPVGKADDYGYGLHNSTSETTLGCIRILARKDLLDLVAACKAAWSAGESVELIVTE